MTAMKRATICSVALALGLASQMGREAMTETPRPNLPAGLSTIPMEMGEWVGRDLEVEPAIHRRSQADDHLNRVYEDRDHPGRRIYLWINYSRKGLNMRHSPEICLPAGGWTKVESQCKVIS